MTPAAWLRDLGAWSLQLAALIAAAALLARLLPLRPPRIALAYWHALLVAGLLLPWGQARPVQQVATVLPVPAAVTRALGPAPATATPQWPWASGLLFVLAGGVALRALWIGAGLLRLRGLRRSGRLLPTEMPQLRRAQDCVGVKADVYVSEAASAPMAFGLRRPAVLLPESVLAMSDEAQHAILCHELLHVRRRDWACAVAEECARAAFWFHPAMAWLVSRIQLVREQAVDRAVLALTGSREAYVEALLAVARAQARPGMLPAPPFLKKGRLRQRVAEIVQEGTMSESRSAVHLVASGAVAALALAGAVRLFPLEARAAEREAPVQVARGGENVLHRAPVEYPRRALERRVEGNVVLELSLDEAGQVQDARVLSGPDELRAAALRSVLRWHYAKPASAPATQQVELRFVLPAHRVDVEETVAETDEPPEKLDGVIDHIEELERKLDDPSLLPEQHEKIAHVLAEREEQLRALAGDQELSREKHRRLERELMEREELLRHRAAERERAEARVGEEIQKLQQASERARAEQELLRDKMKRAAEEDRARAIQEQERMIAKLRGPERLEGRISAIHAARVPEETVKLLLPRLGVKVGDLLDAAALERVGETVRAFDEHLRVQVGRAPDGGVILLLVGP